MSKICSTCEHGDRFCYDAPGGPSEAAVITIDEVFCDNDKTHRKYDGKCYWKPDDCCEFWEGTDNDSERRSN